VDENSATISSYGYSGTPFHAPVSYNENDLDYDANGNLVEDEDFTYNYNDANQLSEVRYASNNSLVEKYWYDANGQRVKKQNSAGEFTYYVNQFYEVNNGTATSYFFRDGERIAKQTDEGMEWYLSDHLGSTTLLVNESGLEVERTEYYPYGQVQSGGLEKYGFTCQENDVDTELMYYGARYYSPEYRVFVQPDTILPDPYNPQYLNRYSYCLNNPVKYTDPSGHIVIPAIAIAGVKVVSTVIDYGWNVYDFATDSWTIVNPNSNVFDKEAAKIGLGLNIASELLDPDELSPVNTPADDIARKALKNQISRELKEGILETAAKNAGKTGVINPKDIRFTQNSISKNFKDVEDGSVDDLIEGLRSGNINPSEVPAIQVFEMKGNLYSLDNRRLHAFQQAGVDIRYVYASPDEINKGWAKLTTQNNGANIKVRNGGK
ncbi:RHS repeat domain-containing protein, partial [Methanolobus psychrotolerans]|uniref:RHS repeat domain-containing protein n=1 Tax=Methanolobus psychrotolerans TaxID=1874706 RepID=UPI00101AE24B